MASNIRAGVLVLPGGKPNSDGRSRPWHLANLRVALLARSLSHRLGADVEVRRVRYRLRGWNAGRLDALGDARMALDGLRKAVGAGPVVVVGHSMGGRVAAHLAADGGVSGVVALAPWWPANDAAKVPLGCRLLTMHGTADTWTDPAASREQTRSAAARGVDADWVEFPGCGHFLLRDYARWHRLTADFAAAQFAQRSQA